MFRYGLQHLGKRLFLAQDNTPVVKNYQVPANMHLISECLTASKMNALHHLALQHETLVILFQEIHCTDVGKPVMPGFSLVVSTP